MGTLPPPAPLSGASFSAVELLPGDDAVVMLDQRELPEREEYLRFEHAEGVAQAIADMVVRGAPAVGISAAYGLVLAAREGRDLEAAAAELRATRPTAVNLGWAVKRMLDVARGAVPSAASHDARPSDVASALAVAARAMHRDEVRACREMGRLGAASVPDGATILTHCNTGALATGGYGTALGVIRAAHEAGKKVRVLATETRPYLQGARLTAWELQRLGIAVTVIPDSAVGSCFARGEITLAVVGADRIASNGDVANKIGTYGIACLAEVHARPFYVAAPWSTVDLDCSSGSDIVIEERAETELTHSFGRRLVPEGVPVKNPAFDVTPARLVTAIFTERGTATPATQIKSLERAG